MNVEFLKEESFITISFLVQQSGLSKSQINRLLAKDNNVRRSIDAKGKFIAHVDVIKQRAFQSGIVFIDGHVFSTEADIISAMAKCIHKSKQGRTRQSFENMFRCRDLSKSFKKLEKRDDIVVIKLKHRYLYISKERKEEQIKYYLRKKGMILREKEKETITFALLFSVLKYNRLDEIEKSIRKSRMRGGRRPFPTKAMVNAILYRVMHKLTSFDALSKELDNNSDLAVALGFDLEQGTPCSSSFSRFVQQVGKHVGKNVDEELKQLLEQKRQLKKKKGKITPKRKYVKKSKAHKRNFILLEEVVDEIKALNRQIREFEAEIPENGWYLIFTDFVTQLLTLQIIDGKIICQDSTHLDASKKDPNRSYGIKRTRKQKDGSIVVVKDFFGYKLHIAVDAKTNLPVAITITTGCVADNTQAPAIIRQLKRHGIFFEAFLADGAYNDKKIYAEIYKYNKNARFICPLPKNEDGTESMKEYYYDPSTRQQYKIWYNEENGRRLFRLRGPTENINKIIKCDLHMNKPKVRGIRAIESLAYIHCIAILAYAVAAKITGRVHLINQFSNLV